MGHTRGVYLLVGSVSLEVLQVGQTLAGRVGHLELGPLDAGEVGPDAHETLWVRGGFPESFLARSEAASAQWRLELVRTYLERDIPQFGSRVLPDTLRRFWTMLAHQQGGVLNVAQLARNVGVDGRTATRYLDLLVDLLLVRRLPAWHANVGKRLVKSPKVYVRDSGLVHSLLAIDDLDALVSHPVVGASWEGFVIEKLLAVRPQGVTAHFYRTSGGAEADLVLAWPDGSVWAIDVKRSLSPRAERGFQMACEDLAPMRRLVVYPGSERRALTGNAEALSLVELSAELAQP
jgi:predicted AAA+ superfamily ATPase